MVSSNIHSMAKCSMIFLTRDIAVGSFGGLDMTVLGKLCKVISLLLFHRPGLLRFRIWHKQVNLWSRVLEKLTVRQLIKKFMAVYKPRRYVVHCHVHNIPPLSIPSARWIQYSLFEWRNPVVLSEYLLYYNTFPSTQLTFKV